MSGTIDRGKPVNPGNDYEVLLAEGTALVQAMSAQIWTDYNYSDPGVTILEQLCYALTELSYRAEFPVADLLGAPDTGQVSPMRQGLYPARAIMPVNPVTANDLRRMIIDRVRHVGNAWFTPVTVDGVSGLYRIDVLIPGLDPDCCDETDPNPAEVLRRVLDCAAAHRGLAEDVNEACVLTPLATRVAADVQIGDHADPDAVLADLLFRLGLRLSPEPKRQPLDAQIAAGRTSSEIFTGPLMLRGFIADDQLTPLPRTFAADDLLEVMAETPGVLSAARVGVRVSPDPVWYYGKQPICLQPGTIARLVTEGDEIRLLRGDAICQTNPRRVRRLLERHWTAQRRTYDLWSAYAAEYPAPVGEVTDLAAYTSVQDQFPAVYAIGEAGLPSGAGPNRQAMARQLKGYLMPFDQLMADYFSQLAFIRDLFSPAAGRDRTYAFQSLRPIVPNVEPLLAPGYEAGLARLIADSDPVTVRQADILGLLLSLYGETLTTPGTLRTDAAALVRARRALLARVVPATRDRGRGFDYRRGGPARGQAGMEIRARIELALLDSAMHHDPHGQAEPDPAKATFGQPLSPNQHATVARGFMTVDLDSFGEDRADAASPLAGHRVAEALLAALGDPARYRMGKLPEHDGVTLVCQDTGGSWWLIGHYGGAREAIAAAHHLSRTAGGERSRLTIVEWTLLRYALPLLDCDGSAFSFRISAVMASDRETHDVDSGWRRRVRAILRDNTPAHIVLDTMFLGHRRMRVFERLHRHWLHALRHGSASRKAETSRDLVLFLSQPATAEQNAIRPAPPAPPAAPVAPVVPVAPVIPVAPVVPVAPATPVAPVSPAEPEPAAGETALVPPRPEPALDEKAREAHLIAFHERLRAGRQEATSAGAQPAPEPPATAASGTRTQAPPSDGQPAAATRQHWWQFWRPAPAATTEPAPPPVQPTGTQPVPEPPKPAPPVIPPAAGGAPTPVAQSAAPGLRGFDTDTALTPAHAQAFAAQGFRFAVRYVSRTTPEAAGDLTQTEAAGILRAGLALMAVQHCAPRGWVPSTALGDQYGAAAVANAAAAGLPRGINLWLDLEGVKAGTEAEDVIGYCNAWYSTVAAAGYLPGLYVGAGQVLTGEQLYRDLKFRYYWKPGAGSVPDVAVRGQCMTQTIDSAFVLDGVKYDEDVTQADAEGNTPVWAVLEVAAEPRV